MLQHLKSSGGDIWCIGKNSKPDFLSLAIRLVALANSSRAAMLNSIYCRLSLLLVRANARAFMVHSNTATTLDLLEGYG